MNNPINQLSQLPPAIAVKGSDFVSLYQDGIYKRVTIDILSKAITLSGYSGFSGISGYYGISGFSGLNGDYAASGISGFSGISGYSGMSSSTIIKNNQIGFGNNDNGIIGSDNLKYDGNILYLEGSKTIKLSIQGEQDRSIQFAYNKLESALVFNTDMHTSAYIGTGIPCKKQTDNIVFYVKNSQIPNSGYQEVMAIVNGNHGKEFGYVQMTGSIKIAKSTSLGSGLVIEPGIDPLYPKEGSVWTTSDGMFIQLNGKKFKVSLEPA